MVSIILMFYQNFSYPASQIDWFLDVRIVLQDVLDEELEFAGSDAGKAIEQEC